MSNKKLMVLGVLAVVMVLLAVAVNNIGDAERGVAEGSSYLIQGLDPDNIDSIVVGAGDDALTLKRRGKRFVITNKDNYPAMANRVSAVLTTCMDIETTELVTSDESNFADLGVTEDAAQAVVRFLDADGKVITGLVLGKSKEDADGGYVRRIDSNDVYFTLSSPWVRSDAAGYMETELAAVAADEIESVTVAAGADRYVLTKDAEGAIVLADLPAGKTLVEAQAKSVFETLTSLRYEDVQASTEGLEFGRTYLCRLKDETLYRLKIAQADDAYYVQVTVVHTGEDVAIDPAAVDSDEVRKAKEEKLIVIETAVRFAAKHKGWVYKIATSAGEKLVKGLDALLADEVKEDAEKFKGVEGPAISEE